MSRAPATRRAAPRTVLLVVLALLVPAARGDADVPDAPDLVLDAHPVAPGAHEGHVGLDEDAADWYRVAHPPGSVVRASVAVAGRGLFELRMVDDQGAHVGAAPVRGGAASLSGHGEDGVRVGVLRGDARQAYGSRYVLTLEVAARPDFAVAGLRVWREPDAPDGTPRRRVEVDVVNLGGDGSGALVLSEAPRGASRGASLATEALVLARGGSRSLAFAWSGPSGEDAVVRARASGHHELDPANDLCEAAATPLGRGHGVGVVLGEAVPACLLPVGGACAWPRHAPRPAAPGSEVHVVAAGDVVLAWAEDALRPPAGPPGARRASRAGRGRGVRVAVPPGRPRVTGPREPRRGRPPQPGTTSNVCVTVMVRPAPSLGWQVTVWAPTPNPMAPA